MSLELEIAKAATVSFLFLEAVHRFIYFRYSEKNWVRELYGGLIVLVWFAL